MLDSSYLLQHNKLPPTLVVENKGHFFSHDFVGQSLAWMVCVFSAVSGALAALLKHRHASVAEPLPSHGLSWGGWTRAGGAETAFFTYLGLGMAVG